MLGNASFEGLSGVLSRTKLSRLRMRARRRGVWFKALSRMDRVLMDLTIRVTDVVRSSKLASLLLAIIKKLKQSLESKVSRALREVGYPLACKLSEVAQEWGNDSARNWKFDESFARFLAVMYVNRSPGYKG